MNDHANRRLIFGLGLVLAAWGILLFFENTYFAAPTFGFQPPWWAAWVGQIPLWGFNAIDSVAVGAFLVVLVLAYLADHKEKAHRRSMKSARGGVAADVLLTLFILAVAGVVLYVVFGLTFPALLQDLRKFLGV